MASRRAWCAAIAVMALAASTCGGNGERPLRIGLIVDCVGVRRDLGDGELAAAQLPLIARGARAAGDSPSDGVRRGRVAGRPVEIVHGCSESGEFSMLTQVARQLVERKHVDVVVDGGPDQVDGLVLREVARRYPDVLFLDAASGPREVTLQRTAANLYRVAPDYGQALAGLATYAYRRLGWRQVALLRDPWFTEWTAETAFVREFCALGGHVAGRVDLEIPPGKASAVLPRIPRAADGVAVLGSWMSVSPVLLSRLAQRGAGTLVLSPDVIGDTDLVRHVADLDGVVGASYAAPAQSSADMRAYLRDYARDFPGAPPEEARDAVVMDYYNAVEAVVRAFEQVHGDLAGGRRRLREQLEHLDTELLGVRVRMDSNGQAVVTSNLVRLGPDGAFGLPQLRPVESVAGVDQSVGGLIAPGYVPKFAGQTCRRATPPPWAR